MSETTTAVTKRSSGTPTIKDLLEQAKPKFAAVLPRHLNVERLIRVTAACISKTPALQKCSPLSLLNCVMQAAQLGLEPTGVLGAAYLVPYGAEATLIIGYRGLIDLARRSGQIESIEAHVVHEEDEFVCEYGLEPKLIHRPNWDADPGPLKFVYAIAKLKDGGKQLEVMSRAQVEAIRSKSKAGRSGPWVDHFEEMARKTVVRRLAKYLPLSVEFAEAVEKEDDRDFGGSRRGEGSSLVSILGSKANETPQPEPETDPAPLATPDQIDRFSALADSAGLSAAQAAAKLGATLDGKQVDYSTVTGAAIEEAIADLTAASQS